MIAEDVLAWHALRNGVLLHRLHLVVRGGAVVAAHDDLRRHAREVQRDAVIQTIGQNTRRRSIGQHRCPEHHDGIGIADTGLLGGDDGPFRSHDGHHVRNGEHRHHGQYRRQHHIQHPPQASLMFLRATHRKQTIANAETSRQAFRRNGATTPPKPNPENKTTRSILRVVSTAMSAFYFATMFTRRPGTTTTFFRSLPATASCTVSSATAFTDS